MGTFTTYKLTGVDFDTPSFKMVGGMDIDDIKIKYNWFLNASVKDAIIGEDENGLVWYSGEWLDGVWETGTWYAGLFHAGRWKDGSFYSYDIDMKEALLGRLLINQKNISKSRFISGKFEGGNFYYGIMGRPNLSIEIPYEITINDIINYNTDFSFVNYNHYDTDGSVIDRPEFLGGRFHDGWINCAIVNGGIVEYALVNNTYWKLGDFKSGVFLGDLWVNGNFYGGDFSNGRWISGLFTILSASINSRFGTDYKNIGGIVWESGTFENGELHSRLNVDASGNPLISLSNQHTKWLSGVFNGGIIYGIYWIKGTMNSGIIKNGHYDNIVVENGVIDNCYCNVMVLKNGKYNGGYIKTFTQNGGYISYE